MVDTLGCVITDTEGDILQIVPAKSEVTYKFKTKVPDENAIHTQFALIRYIKSVVEALQTYETDTLIVVGKKSEDLLRELPFEMKKNVIPSEEVLTKYFNVVDAIFQKVNDQKLEFDYRINGRTGLSVTKKKTLVL